MMKRIFFLLMPAIWLMGCAGTTTTTQAATEITVEAIDFAYNPLSITIPAGEPIALVFKNSGNVEHDFVIENINVLDVQASNTGPAEHHQMGHMPDYDLHFYAKAGETSTLQFTALEPGSYEIFCSVEGHKEAGMIGELVVTAQE